MRSAPEKRRPDMNHKRTQKKQDREVWNAMVMVLQFGINMMVPIALCMALGIWIGTKTGADWVAVPFFFIGALAGGTNIYKFARKMIRDADQENASTPAGQKAARSGKTPDLSEDSANVEKDE